MHKDIFEIFKIIIKEMLTSTMERALRSLNQTKRMFGLQINTLMA